MNSTDKADRKLGWVAGPGFHPHSTDWQDKQIKDLLHKYRIECDMAWSEVVDKFHTQEEYEEALKKIDNNYLEDFQSLIDASKKEGYKEGFQFYMNNICKCKTKATISDKEFK